MERNFQYYFDLQQSQRRQVCVGLDTNDQVVQKMVADGLNLSAHDPDLLTPTATVAEQVVAYNVMVLKATADIAGMYKPNLQFYLPLGHSMFWALRETINWAHEIAPDVPVVLDAKFQDIGSSNSPSVRFLDMIGADGTTLHPYLGSEASQPFLERTDKGFFVLTRTSNPGGGELQDLYAGYPSGPHEPLYRVVADMVRNKWNQNMNCGLVAGATRPREAGQIRGIVGPDMMILIPGVGAQGGEAKDIVPEALRKGDKGVINSSRGIIFAKPSEGETQFDAIRREALILHNDILLAQNTA